MILESNVPIDAQMYEKYLQKVEVEHGASGALAGNSSGVHSVAGVIVRPVKGKLHCCRVWLFTNQWQPESISDF